MPASDHQLAHDHADVELLLNDAAMKLEHDDAVDALNALDIFWARLAMHIRAEHLHLFPAALRTAGAPSDIVEILVRLRLDHDFFMHELADAIKVMRSIGGGSEPALMRETAERLEGIRRRLDEHNAIEEEQIYPLQELMAPTERKQLAHSIAKELLNLPPRFTRSE
jgi:hemerythrin superfamily protein